MWDRPARKRKRPPRLFASAAQKCSQSRNARQAHLSPFVGQAPLRQQADGAHDTSRLIAFRGEYNDRLGRYQQTTQRRSILPIQGKRSLFWLRETELVPHVVCKASQQVSRVESDVIVSSWACDRLVMADSAGANVVTRAPCMCRVTLRGMASTRYRVSSRSKKAARKVRCLRVIVILDARCRGLWVRKVLHTE
jgi:hypothetical protein